MKAIRTFVFLCVTVGLVLAVPGPANAEVKEYQGRRTDTSRTDTEGNTLGQEAWMNIDYTNHRIRSYAKFYCNLCRTTFTVSAYMYEGGSAILYSPNVTGSPRAEASTALRNCPGTRSYMTQAAGSYRDIQGFSSSLGINSHTLQTAC